jgi:hypothetical protein
MSKSLLLLTLFLIISPNGWAQATVREERPNLQGSPSPPEQTGKAAIRDYLQSWKNLSSALEQNRPELLDSSFVGIAREKLSETIRQQTILGAHSIYRDRAHDIQIVFYSPEGLSIELTDKVQYDLELVDHSGVKMVQHLSARYVIVLTPAEVRWRVRVFQAEPE